MQPPSDCTDLHGTINRVRAVVQRVTRAAVRVEGEIVSEIGEGLCVLIGVSRQDGEEDALSLADKIVGLRIFRDSDGLMNVPLGDRKMLIVSQFTLISEVGKGRRPSFVDAASPARAQALIGCFVQRIRESGTLVAGGVFGAMMEVELVNDGPVTFVIDTLDGRVL